MYKFLLFFVMLACLGAYPAFAADSGDYSNPQLGDDINKSTLLDGGFMVSPTNEPGFEDVSCYYVTDYTLVIENTPINCYMFLGYKRDHLCFIMYRILSTEMSYAMVRRDTVSKYSEFVPSVNTTDIILWVDMVSNCLMVQNYQEDENTQVSRIMMFNGEMAKALGWVE